MTLEHKLLIVSGLFMTLSLCFLPAVQAQLDPALSEVSLPGSKQIENAPSRAMNAALTVIASAKQLEDASLKGGKIVTSVNQALKLGAPARDDLEWIIANGSPAGRLYATSILGRFDQAAAKDAYRALAAGMGDVNVDYLSAHEHCHYSVADIVTDQTSPKPLIEIVPKAAKP